MIQVGISHNTGLCISSSDAQPQMRVISPGCPDLGRHTIDESGTDRYKLTGLWAWQA